MCGCCGKERTDALLGTHFLIEHQVPSIHFVLYVHILVLQCVAFFLNDEEIGHPHIPPLRLALLSCDEPFLSCEATRFHCGKLVSWNGATYTMAFCKCASWAAGCQDHILFSLLRTYWGEEVTGLRWNVEIYGSIRIHPRMEGRNSRSVIYIYWKCTVHVLCLAISGNKTYLRLDLKSPLKSISAHPMLRRRMNYMLFQHLYLWCVFLLLFASLCCH